MIDFLCMLATDWTGNVPAGGMMVEEKFDGIRALRFVGADGATRLWTRGGRWIEGTGHILHRLALMEQVAGQRMMFDGEFVVDGSLAATKAWFERGWKSGDEAGVFHAFDVLPYADWARGRCDMPLHERKTWLESLCRAADEGRPAVLMVADQWAHDAHDAIDIAGRIWARGGEGCVAKDAEALYERRRTRAWMKIKPDGPWQHSPPFRG